MNDMGRSEVVNQIDQGTSIVLKPSGANLTFYCVFRFLLLVIPFIAFYIAVSIFEVVYGDFGVCLPSLTVFVLNLSMFIRQYFVFVLPFVFIVLAIDVLIYIKLYRNAQNMVVLWSMFITCMQALLIILITIGLMLPMYKIVENISS